MRKVVDFEVIGFQPAPWSVPDICVTRSGQRFSKRRGKSHLAEGRVNLKDWQRLVSESATRAMEGQPPVSGPVLLETTFYIRATDGYKAGEPCFLALKFNKKSLQYVKQPLKGCTLPDLTNLVKGTEDALQGVVFRDDFQVVSESCYRKWGSHGGCRIRVYLLEETYEETTENASAPVEKPPDDGRVRARRAPKKRLRSDEAHS